MKTTKFLYEEFHSVTKLHKKIVSIDDFTHGEILKIISSHINEGMQVLDIGCGTGSVSLWVSRHAKSVVGIDISNRAIQSCKHNAKALGVRNARFICESIEGHREKNKYDLIIMLEVLEHLENDDKVLKQVHGMLKNGGTLLLSSPSVNAPLYKIGYLKGFDKRVGHLRRYSTNMLVSLIQSTGFNVQQTMLYEGILRNIIFTSKIGGLILKLINRSSLFSRMITKYDVLSLKMFGESDIIIVATKP